MSALLAEKGAAIIDFDAIVHEVQAPGGRAYQGIVDRFGPDVVLPDGSLDRAKLASIVFNNPEARTDLNRLTYPALGAVVAERMNELSKTDRVVVLDIPLLAEGSRKQYQMAGVIVVDIDPEVAVERLVGQRGMDEDDARRRQAAQASRDQRLTIADHIIDNSGTIEELRARVDAAWAWVETLRPAQAAAEKASEE